MPRRTVENWRFEWLTKWDEVGDLAFITQWNVWMEESPEAHVFFKVGEYHGSPAEVIE